jgi:ribosomal protein S18 acetylase RimI-like enzyme
MTRLYFELSRAPQTHLWVALERGQVVAFLAGCANVQRSYRWVLMRPALLARLFLASWTVARLGLGRLLSPFSYISRARVPADGALSSGAQGVAELLAIAVKPQLRQRGVAKMLVEIFEQTLRDWGDVATYRVSTNIADVNSNTFYRRLGFSPCGTIKHHDLVLQTYEKSLAPASGHKPQSRAPGDNPAQR